MENMSKEQSRNKTNAANENTYINQRLVKICKENKNLNSQLRKICDNRDINKQTKAKNSEISVAIIQLNLLQNQPHISYGSKRYTPVKAASIDS